MDIALEKLDLLQRMLLISDEAALQRVAKVIEEEVPEVDLHFTDEERAELDRRRAEYLCGEGTSYTVEESLQRLRSGKR